MPERQKVIGLNQMFLKVYWDPTSLYNDIS